MRSKMPTQKINVLLADDHTVVRQAFRILLEAEADLAVVGEAETGRQAVELAKKLTPEVVVMDIAMPVLNGLEATRQILREVPSTRVLILSSYNDDEYVRRLHTTGASGYLLKQSAAPDLVKAIREIRKGKAIFGPAVSQRLIAHYRQTILQGTHVSKRSDRLTSREM